MYKVQTSRTNFYCSSWRDEDGGPSEDVGEAVVVEKRPSADSDRNLAGLEAPARTDGGRGEDKVAALAKVVQSRSQQAWVEEKGGKSVRKVRSFMSAADYWMAQRAGAEQHEDGGLGGLLNTNPPPTRTFSQDVNQVLADLSDLADDLRVITKKSEASAATSPTLTLRARGSSLGESFAKTTTAGGAAAGASGAGPHSMW